MSDRDDGLQQVIDLLKQPVRLDSSFDAKVMEQVESVPPPRAWARSLWTVADWMRRGRTLTVSPAAGIGAGRGPGRSAARGAYVAATGLTRVTGTDGGAW